MEFNTFARGVNIVEEEAEQYRYNMLAEIAALPSQDDIELTDEMLDTELWKGISARSGYEIKRAFQPTLRDYLQSVNGADREFLVGVPAMEMYNYVCLQFGFRPNVNIGLQRFMRNRGEEYRDRGLDIAYIDQMVNQHFLTELDFEEIGLQAATIEKFRQAEISTVGDFVLKGSTNYMQKFFGIHTATLKKVAEFINNEYGVNRRDLKTHPILRESLFTRYAVMKGSQSTTE